MSKKPYSASDWGGSLNTLAQNGTIDTKIITGDGSEMGADKDLKKRAQRKVIAQRTAIAMIDVANANGDYDWLKTLWNTYKCQNKLTSSEGKLYTIYCKNRFCPTCGAIRKAEIIKRYYPTIKKWAAPQLVTLTMKSCKANGLKMMFENMLHNFKLINQKYRKQNQRGKGVRLMGIKSLESCFNPEKRTYNPHMHLIVASKEIAEILVKEWLAIFPKGYTFWKGQSIERVYDLNGALIETIKYGSKIFTLPDVKLQKGENATIYARANFNIYGAMDGLRIFDRFGFNLPKTAPKERHGAKVVIDAIKWKYHPTYHDWFCEEHEAPLTGYSPSPSLVDILVNHMNKELE